MKNKSKSEQLTQTQLAADDSGRDEKKRLAIDAYHGYKEAGDYNAQFYALMQAAFILQQTASYEAASVCITIAQQRLQLTDLGNWAQVFILNADALIHWSQGDLIDALTIADNSILLADQIDSNKFRIYNRLLKANILCALSRYHRARRAYEDTYQAIEEENSEEFRGWVDVNLGWLDILEEHYGAGKRRIMKALDTADSEQAVSFNMFLAASYNVTGRYQEAERLLLTGLDHYQETGNDLSAFAVKLHLAYACLHMNRLQDACAYLTPALQWAEQKNVDYFPYWWHPRLVSEVCIHVLKSHCSPAIAKRMLIKRLPGEAVSLLSRELPHASPTTRRRIEDILESLNAASLPDLSWISDPIIRSVLVELLRSGRLRADHFLSLQRKLTTAQKRNTFNPVVVAVFGLYVHGFGRKEIARRLGRSEPTVRNYITFIYEQFGLHETPMIESRFDRRIKLREVSQKEGFIDADEGPTYDPRYQF